MAIKTATINVRMEPTLKEQATDVFTESGLSFSDAVNAFCKEAVRRGTIPFRFTARKDHPLDMSKMTDREFATKIKKGINSPARPASTVFKEMEEVLN